MRVDLEHVSVDRGGRRVVDDVSLTVSPGQVVGIVGPNGSGKSTLLRTIIGILHPAAGSVRVAGRDVRTTKPRTLARTLAAVLQDTTGDFDLTVHDVVAMGRACHKSPFARDNAHDATVIAGALDRVGAAHLASRPFPQLSGGERQRVLIARALAQEPDVLVMDEPTNHLDVRNQFDTLALPRDLGITAVIALHDLNLAAHYCDEIHVLHHGRQWRGGPPAEVLGPDLLTAVYGVAGTVTPHPSTGRPHVTLDPERSAGLLRPARPRCCGTSH